MPSFLPEFLNHLCGEISCQVSGCLRAGLECRADGNREEQGAKDPDKLAMRLAPPSQGSSCEAITNITYSGVPFPRAGRQPHQAGLTRLQVLGILAGLRRRPKLAHGCMGPYLWFAETISGSVHLG
ncbi:hypothetical protein CRG98_004106 [Punica granatum]|uniref:Uncharacterized protein n=1 Tax=Punica granatum TaxID=22663 RepID=A0A2I0L5M6_PUNGR|nr:hypothetical protein CRG98_004106 [Punica granatum]